MQITKENIQLMDTIAKTGYDMELSENNDYYFLTVKDVDDYNIKDIVCNAKYYKSCVFYSYSYNIETKDIILTFKKIKN